MISIILQTFGILFILLVAVGGYLLYRLGRYWRSLGRDVQLEDYMETPSRVTLLETVKPAWAQHTDLQNTLSELRTMGFQFTGTYEVMEMPCVHIVGMVHPEDYLYAAVYLISAKRLWTELYSERRDGERLTVSNVDTSGMLDHTPGHRHLSNSSWRIAELYDCMKTERGIGPFKDTERADFKSAFEHAYALEMDWRNSRGGVPTWEEFVRIARKRDAISNDKKLRTTYYDAVYQQGVLRLSEECIATFCTETTLTVPEWEVVRHTCFALHEHIPNSHLADFVADHFCHLDPKRIEQLKQSINPSLPTIENFARFNNTLPEHLQAVKLGDVDTPVQAEIFATPLRPDSLDVHA